MSSDADTTQASWEVPEAIWRRMEPLIPPGKSRGERPQTVNLKRIIEGLCLSYIGIQWQAYPRQRFGPPSTVYDDFRPWVTAGVCGQLWAVALTVDDDLQGLEWAWQRVDGAMTKAPVGARPRAPIPRTVEVRDKAQCADGRARRAPRGRRGRGQSARHDTVGCRPGRGRGGAAGAHGGSAAARMPGPRR